MGAFGLALLAGVLTTLSPCVLPLVPVVVGAAAAEHRYGPAALAVGLALSFVTIGLFVATIGFSIGLDGGAFRMTAAVLMVAIGIVLVAPSLQTRLAIAGGPAADWAGQRFGGFSTSGLQGQFGVGLLLGAVWSPCVGPTLGAASLLAAQGKNLSEVALTMALFGIGASAPLLVLGLLAREALMRRRGSLLAFGQSAKAAMGVLLILFGAIVISGADKILETALVNASPQWLTNLTTRF